MSMVWRIGPLEITIFHVALVFGVAAVYLLILFFTKYISLPIFYQNQPTVFRQFHQIPNLQTLRSHNFSIFCGSERQSCPGTHDPYDIDRLTVQKTLRQLFDQSITLPENCVAVQIPTIFSTCGPEFHQFKCKPPVPEWTAQSIIRENQYSYKMFAGGQIQAVYHIDRRCHFLAGLLIYLRIPGSPWYFRGVSEGFVMEMLRGNVRKCSTMGLATIRILDPRIARTLQNISRNREDVENPPVEVEESEEEDSEDEDEVPELREPPPPPYATIIENDLPPDYFSLFSRLR